MKVLLLLALVLAAAGTARDIMPISDEVAALALVTGNNEFAMDLYREVSNIQQDDNIFFSPYSVSMALGMTWNGASGNTAVEMASVLHFSVPVWAVNMAFESVTETISSGRLSEMETGDPFTLAISNGLWVQDGYELLNSFVSAVTQYYGASVENLDFAGDTEGSRETINSWVAENTLDKILNLIPPGVLTVDTRIVLTNAVYFKASWQHPFNEYPTSEGRFLLDGGGEVSTPMMMNIEDYRYAASDEWSAVSLNYAGGDASMLIIMPSGSMGEFQESFDSEMVENIRGQLNYRYVQLSMPSFEFTRSMPLSSILTGLGMETAFTENANFCGICDTDLFISEVIHKAYVKVDEEGTEAAAATAVVMTLEGMPSQPVEVNINRPFVFMIQDNLTGTIVFMGRVMDPTV